MIKITIFLLSLISSVSLLEAVNVGADTSSVTMSRFNDVSSNKKNFYFSPNQIDSSILLHKEKSHDFDENKCTAMTRNHTCLRLSQKNTILLPDYPRCSKHEILLKHGDNQRIIAGIVTDETSKPHEPCDAKIITHRTITPLQDGGYLLSWFSGLEDLEIETTMTIKKFNANGKETVVKENFIPKLDLLTSKIKALKNGNFVISWISASSVIVKVYNPNIKLLSTSSFPIKSRDSVSLLIKNKGHDGSFDILYKTAFDSHKMVKKHFSGN